MEPAGWDVPGVHLVRLGTQSVLNKCMTVTLTGARLASFTSGSSEPAALGLASTRRCPGGDSVRGRVRRPCPARDPPPALSLLEFSCHVLRRKRHPGRLRLRPVERISKILFEKVPDLLGGRSQK